MIRLSRTRPSLCFVWNPVDGASRPPVGFDDGVWTEVDLLQVRGKGLADCHLERVSRTCVEGLADHPTRVVVNDRLDIAIASGAAGVHLGQRDLSVEAARRVAPDGFIIGVSTHDRRELLNAQAEGAAYAGLGAFASTSTKPDAARLDPVSAGVREPVEGLEIPVLAIGGIDAESVRDAFDIPAVTGVAVSAAMEQTSDPAGAIRALRHALEQAWDSRSRPVPCA